jgi:hypothetical protein
MNPVPAVLLRYIEGLKTHDVARIAETVSEQLAFVSAGRTLDKRQFLAMLTALYAAFPDWRYEHDEPESRGSGRFAIKWRQAGTHTGTLALPAFPVVAPTGKVVRIPEQFFFYTVTEKLIIEIRPEPIAGGAPWGIFEQIAAPD